MSDRPVESLIRVADRLHEAYGPQGWWPAESDMEMMAGAVLVQHARWEAAERALSRLTDAGLMDAVRLAHHDREELTRLIRPAGQPTVKVRRLQALARRVWELGGVAVLRQAGTEQLRAVLLDVYGVGPETADAILVYVFDRPRMIASAYARRLVERMGIGLPTESYQALAEAAMEPFESGRIHAGEFHAQVVAHARTRCLARRPRCGGCPLRRPCRYVGESAQARS